MAFVAVVGSEFLSTNCYREKVPGTVFYTTGAFKPTSLTPTMCMQGCLKAGDPRINLAGTSGGSVCLCGTGNESAL